MFPDSRRAFRWKNHEEDLLKKNERTKMFSLPPSACCLPPLLITGFRRNRLHPRTLFARSSAHFVLTLLALQSFSAALELAKGFEPPTL
jgi:hypothetical protein